MPESYTPKEINDYINSHNNGPKFDPYGSEELSNRLRATQGEGGDIFASAELEVAAREQKLAEARAALANFTTYLERYLSPETIQDKLGDLAVYYDETTGSAVIARPDRQPFALNLGGCGLEGDLPLPKQLLINRLKCYNNQLTSLPELPDSLTVLNCNRNQLTSLPELPDSLTGLWCRDNQLTSLPELPDSLTELWCRDNQLTSLPELPDSLTELYCDRNQLTSLPELPDSLTVLWCTINQLTSLPELPDSLTWLACSYNPLTEDARQKIRERKQRQHFKLTV